MVALGVCWGICSILSLGGGIGLCVGGHTTVGASMISAGVAGIVGMFVGVVAD